MVWWQNIQPPSFFLQSIQLLALFYLCWSTFRRNSFYFQCSDIPLRIIKFRFRWSVEMRNCKTNKKENSLRTPWNQNEKIKWNDKNKVFRFWHTLLAIYIVTSRIASGRSIKATLLLEGVKLRIHAMIPISFKSLRETKVNSRNRELASWNKSKVNDFWFEPSWGSRTSAIWLSSLHSMGV